MKSRSFLWIVALGVGASCASEESNPGAGVTDVGTGTSGQGGGGVAGTSGTATPTDPTAVPTGQAGSTAPIDPTGTIPDPGGQPTTNPTDNPIEGLLIPPNCQGINFQGILYSPGGTNLPNICEPFDPTVNNPYAVRCIDAWPWFQTQFPGDEYCILPPPPDLGIQFGMHPQGDPEVWFAQVSTGDLSGYANPSAEWTMASGQEAERNYTGGTNNPAEHNFYRTYVRMRAGSHHMINSAGATAPRGTWGPGSAAGLASGTGLPGAQRPDENAPKTLDKPIDDAGLYSIYPANPNITFNVHHFNPSPQTTLKEAWVNLWWETDATIRVRGVTGLSLLQPITLSIAPNTTMDLHYSWTNFTQPTRVVTLFGHRHAWTSNFSAWVERPGGVTEIVYQSFDWFDQPTYRYDSATQNPIPMPEQRLDGGHSGLLTVVPGEELHFNCHITYTEARAVAENAPSPSAQGTIGFANEAFTGEMCILFGSAAGTALAGPAGDSSPLPSFATID